MAHICSQSTYGISFVLYLALMRLWCWCIEINPCMELASYTELWRFSLQKQIFVVAGNTLKRAPPPRPAVQFSQNRKHLLRLFSLFILSLYLFRANGEIRMLILLRRRWQREKMAATRCVHSSSSFYEKRKYGMLNERKTLVQCRAVTKWLRDDERTSVHATLRTATLSVVRQARRSRVEGQ